MSRHKHDAFFVPLSLEFCIVRAFHVSGRLQGGGGAQGGGGGGARSNTRSRIIRQSLLSGASPTRAERREGGTGGFLVRLVHLDAASPALPRPIASLKSSFGQSCQAGARSEMKSLQFQELAWGTRPCQEPPYSRPSRPGTSSFSAPVLIERRIFAAARTARWRS